MKLTLPYPVSSNRYWRSFSYLDKATRKPRAVVVLSQEAKAYKTEAAWLAKAAGLRTPLDGQGFDVVYRRTSHMSKRELSELLEYVTAWAVDNEVQLREAA